MGNKSSKKEVKLENEIIFDNHDTFPMSLKEFGEILRCYSSITTKLTIKEFSNLLPKTNPRDFFLFFYQTRFVFTEHYRTEFISSGCINNSFVFYSINNSGFKIIFNYKENKFENICTNFWFHDSQTNEFSFHFINDKIIIQTEEDEQIIFRLLCKMTNFNSIKKINSESTHSKKYHPVILKRIKEIIEYYYKNNFYSYEKSIMISSDTIKSPENHHVTFEEIFRLSGLTKVPFDQLKKYLPVYKKMESSNERIFEKNLFKTILEYVF